MSKAAAIHVAVCLQIASEGKVVPGLNGALRDPAPPAPGAPAPAPGAPAPAGQYVVGQIRGFLANVAFRLRNDTPPLDFKWSALDKDESLNNPLWQLEQAIFDNTTEIVPAAPKQ